MRVRTVVWEFTREIIGRKEGLKGKEVVGWATIYTGPVKDFNFFRNTLLLLLLLLQM
jgi:hypothetical protein